MVRPVETISKSTLPTPTVTYETVRLLPTVLCQSYSYIGVPLSTRLADILEQVSR